MKKLMIVIAGTVLAGASAILPARAQFEVSPDHFSDAAAPSVPQASAHRTAVSPDRAGLAREIESYRALIRHQEQQVDDARQQACGAGGMEDSAYVFVDEYLRQARALEQLKRDLSPRIVLAQARLEALDGAEREVAASGPRRHTTNQLTSR